MGRGRSGRLAPAALRQRDLSWARDRVLDAGDAAPAFLRLQGIALLRSPRRDGQGGARQGGVAIDDRFGAGDLVETALWLSEAGERAHATEVLERARAHQVRHIAALERAAERPRLRTARELWEAHGAAGADQAAAREAIRAGAQTWKDLIDALMADHGHLGAGPTIGHARLERRRFARRAAISTVLAMELEEGRYGRARALLTALWREEGTAGAEASATRMDDEQLGIAAALLGAALVDAEREHPVIEVGELIDRLPRLGPQDLRRELGDRWIGELGAPMPAAGGGCPHPVGRWRWRVGADSVGLSCDMCPRRLAVIPAHRLPEESADPAIAASLARARAAEHEYVRAERRHRALARAEVPDGDVSFESLRAGDGILEPADVIRALQDSRVVSRRRTGGLSQALGARRGAS